MSTFFFPLGIWERDSLEGMLLLQPPEVPKSSAGCWRMFGTWGTLLTWPNLGATHGSSFYNKLLDGRATAVLVELAENMCTHIIGTFNLTKYIIQHIPKLFIASNASSEWGSIFITPLPISYFSSLTFTVISYMPSCLMLSYLEPFGNMIHHFSNFSRLPLLVNRLQRELFSLILWNCPLLLILSVISKILWFKEKTKMKKKQCNWKAA